MAPLAPIAVISGSGIRLEPLLDRVDAETSFGEMDGVPEASVPGHSGRFLTGMCGDQLIILQCGRIHMYEGHEYESATAPINILHQLGVRKAILTSAAGGLLPAMEPGSLVAVRHVRSFGPRTGHVLWPDAPASIRTDFLAPGCDFAGDYMWVTGANYETRAEISAMRLLGGAVVGMSAAPEVQRCRELDVQVAVIACVTNNCCTPAGVSHGEVLAGAEPASERLLTLLREYLAGA